MVARSMRQRNAPHAHKDLDECLGELWRLGGGGPIFTPQQGRRAQAADGSEFVNSIKSVVEKGKKRKQDWERGHRTQVSCLLREQERFPQKVIKPMAMPEDCSETAWRSSYLYSYHIRPPPLHIVRRFRSRPRRILSRSRH